MMYVSDYVGCSSPLNFGKGDITFLEFQDLYKSISFLTTDFCLCHYQSRKI